MRTAILTITGIIRDPFSSQPAADGLALYTALCAGYRVYLLADDPQVQEWLRTERITSHVGVACAEPHTDLATAHVNQVAALRARGTVDLVVTADPDVCAALLTKGQPTMLYAHPWYTHLHHRPGLTAWNALEAAIETSRELAAIAAETQEEEVE